MFVATSNRHTTTALLQGLAHRIPSQWPVDITEHRWGGLLVAVDEQFVSRNSRWLVVGRPSADPWGDPRRRLPLARLLEDLDAYGAVALTMTAGPCLAIDLEDGRAHRPLNGLVGFGPDPTLPGVWSSVAPSGPPDGSAIVADASPAFSLERLVAEVEAHTPAAGDSLELVEPCDLGEVLVTEVPGCASLRPSDPVALLAPEHYRFARDHVLPWLQYLCNVSGHWLHSPLFERPCLDQIGFAGQAAEALTGAGTGPS